jgi:SAM-dependent methyltransferase
VSDGHAPLGAANRSNQGWLVRLMRGVVRGLFGVDLDQIEAEVDRGRAALSRETVAREGLQRHLEKRMDEVSAVVEDVRGAYLATRSEFEQVRDTAIPRLTARLGLLGDVEVAAEPRIAAPDDGRLADIQHTLTVLQKTSEALQRELESLRDVRAPHIEDDLLRMQHAIEAVQALAEELRDRRLPALAARTDALVERLHEELSVLGGLLDRVVQSEPLRIAVEPEMEAALPAAISAATTRFVDAFRGERAEILGRVSEYCPLLNDAAPVLELGCGRGELLEALRDAGVEARGVDSDPAMVAACRRLGLAAEEGDALEVLRNQKTGSLGGVTAIHVLEHLPAATWMSVVEAAGAALRRGGVLLVECPNPDSLRVGAGLFWMDPTHRAPVHPQALAFVMRALGLEVVETRLLHPFPPEQALANASQPEAVRELAGKLDAWLSGPRDFLVVARKP